MKNMKKFLVGILCVFAMVAMIKVPVNAASNFWQSSATQNSATLEWNNQIFSGTTVTSIFITYNGKQYNYGSSVRRATFSNLPDNFAGRFTLGYKYKSGNYTYTRSNAATIYVNTVPTNVATPNFGIYSSTGSAVRIGVARPSANTTGAIVELYKNNSYAGTYEAKYKDSSFFYTELITPAKNAIYKYRVIYFYDNKTSGHEQRYTSPAFSDFRQFVIPSVSGRAKSNKKGFSMKLKRITGASKYLVQLSQDGVNFMSAKSVKITKKKKTYSFQVTKKYKKKMYNHIRLYTYISGYGYSDYVWNGKIYIFK